MALKTVIVDPDKGLAYYRDFLIQESIDGWEWTHKAYDRETYPVTGTVDTMFEAITAVDDWHDVQ